MSVIYILIGLSIIVASAFLFAFLWAVRSGQYEDDQTPAMRMLFDDEKSNEGPIPVSDNPIPTNTSTKI